MDNDTDGVPLQKQLNLLHRRFRRRKLLGVMVLLIASVLGGLFSALTIYVYYYDNDFKLVFVIMRAILLSLGIAFYIVVLYM